MPKLISYMKVIGSRSRPQKQKSCLSVLFMLSVEYIDLQSSFSVGTYIYRLSRSRSSIMISRSDERNIRGWWSVFD